MSYPQRVKIAALSKMMQAGIDCNTMRTTTPEWKRQFEKWCMECEKEALWDEVKRIEAEKQREADQGIPGAPYRLVRYP